MTRQCDKFPRSEDRDGFRFRGGSAALDLTATLQARTKPTPRELLATPRDLDRWIISAGLSSSPPRATERDLGTALALREAIFALAGNLEKSDFPARDRDVLNRIASAPAAAPRLGANGSITFDGPVARLLSSLAREAVQSLGGEVAARIRQCQSPNCTIFFVDGSRSGERRWCSMSACGNKAKVAEFRRRKHASASDV